MEAASREGKQNRVQAILRLSEQRYGLSEKPLKSGNAKSLLTAHVLSNPVENAAQSKLLLETRQSIAPPNLLRHFLAFRRGQIEAYMRLAGPQLQELSYP